MISIDIFYSFQEDESEEDEQFPSDQIGADFCRFNDIFIFKTGKLMNLSTLGVSFIADKGNINLVTLV